MLQSPLPVLTTLYFVKLATLFFALFVILLLHSHFGFFHTNISLPRNATCQYNTLICEILPGTQLSGAQTALLALILWAYLMISSEEMLPGGEDVMGGLGGGR